MANQSDLDQQKEFQEKARNGNSQAVRAEVADATITATNHSTSVRLDIPTKTDK